MSLYLPNDHPRKYDWETIDSIERDEYNEEIDCDNLQEVLYYHCQNNSDQLRILIVGYYYDQLTDEKKKFLRNELDEYREENGMSDEEADGYWANESDPLRAETLHFQCEPDLLESSVENYISNLKEAEKTELLQHLLDEYEE